MRFASRSGRYVVWRRVEAWGSHTRQAGESWPGYANANEVWVYPPAPAALLPLDTDHDGLADYEEDANGNGQVEPDETDPNQPISRPMTGRLDSEWQARTPELEVFKYTNYYSKLRYAASPSAPDAEFTMSWYSKWRGSAQRKGDYTRLSPPPSPPLSFTQRGDDFAWGITGPGSQTHWVQHRDGSQRRTLLGPVDQPPSALLPVPWERCTDAAFTNSLGDTYTRSARTEVRLNGNGGIWPKNTKSVWLSVSVLDKSAGDSLNWDVHDYFLQKPNTLWLGREVDPAVEEIRVDGRVVDAQGLTLVQVPRSGSKDVSPSLPGCSWYMYELILCGPREVRMSWSRHPRCPSVNLQALFDEGALLLAEDNDSRIRDDHPQVTPGSPQFNNDLYITDDVPTYMEFFIVQARRSTFPGTWVFEDKPLTDPAFNDIRNERHLNFLLHARFANIKLVNTIVLRGFPLGGLGIPGVPGIVLARQMGPPNVIYLNAPTAIHEFGHTAGLEDRGSNGNPGDPNDVTAIMHSLVGGTEVNRFERDKLDRWDPAFWDEVQP